MFQTRFCAPFGPTPVSLRLLPQPEVSQDGDGDDDDSDDVEDVVHLVFSFLPVTLVARAGRA
jgi:hypothetical protein